MKTAKEFIKEEYKELTLKYFNYESEIDTTALNDVAEMLIKFTKLHVKETLKKAAECLPYDDKLNRDMMLIEKIENCYPLNNIK